ncbi:fatty acid CoA ligase family protein [Motilimonas sp. 1_MG-2023]|uniref:fatty acid CoA ligase family protein n=1 Tax=Motilimonas sp. 1_MG-2023 TaxID=3062672 RepID=UPI003014CFDF
MTKTQKGSQQDLAIHTNIANHLTDMAGQQPSALAIAIQTHSFFGKVAHYTELNFAQLEAETNLCAWALHHKGVNAGDKVVLMVTPSVDFFALTFALFRLGAIPIFVDPGMGIKNLKQCFDEAKPDVFIGIDKAHIARVLFSWGKSTLRLNITVGQLGYCARLSKLKQKVKQDFAFESITLKPNAMAAILFTSGSTGVPKGVVYSHGMFNAQIHALKGDYGIAPGERDLATFPLFALFGPALGMASIIPDMDASKPIKARPEYIFAAIERYKCSNLFANPALMDVLGRAGSQSHRKLDTLKRVISAGAPATPASIARFEQLLNETTQVWTSYGATESLPISKIGSHELLSETQDITDQGGGICVGSAVAGIDIKIIKITDLEVERMGQAKLAAPGEIGEICVKGPVVSPRYFERDKATALAKIQDEIQGGFYHRMGDVGYLDSFGRLWMCGRKSHRVTLLETELYTLCCERIFNLHPLVNRTALVGVIKKGVKWPVLCVELKPDATKNNDEKVLFRELALIGMQHPHTKIISQFLVHPSFPVDVRHNAKIFREKLAVWAQQQIDQLPLVSINQVKKQ